MEILIVGAYWFLNGVLFVFFTIKCLKFRQNTFRWFLGLSIAFSLSILLLLGATICFDHYLF